MQKSIPNFLNAQEVAKIYFCNKLTYRRVLEMTKSNMLPAIKEGKGYIYSKEALDNWTARYMTKPINN